MIAPLRKPTVPVCTGSMACTIIENEDFVKFYRDYVFVRIWERAKSKIVIVLNASF